jgi:hypothetical protein
MSHLSEFGPDFLQPIFPALILGHLFSGVVLFRISIQLIPIELGSQRSYAGSGCVIPSASPG